MAITGRAGFIGHGRTDNPFHAGYSTIKKFIVAKMKWRNMRPQIISMVLVITLLSTGCVNAPQETGNITSSTPATLPPATPEITTITTPSAQNPIVGLWQNGLTFYANGTATVKTISGTGGSEGFSTWKANPDEKNSYFIVSDRPSELDHARDILSTEWIYVPASDGIHRKGSSVMVYRG
jgi:hypothetical protein